MPRRKSPAKKPVPPKAEIVHVEPEHESEQSASARAKAEERARAKNAIVSHVADFLSFVDACKLEGVAVRTAYDWLADDVGFAAEYERAKVQAKTKALDCVRDTIKDRDHSQSLSAATWWLERKHPKEFGKAAVEVNISQHAGGIDMGLTREDFAAMSTEDLKKIREAQAVVKRIREARSAVAGGS
jgi:hypothetical protein